MALVLVTTIFVLMALGTSLLASFGVGSVLALKLAGLPMYLIPQAMYGGIASFTLLAIPLFILAGEILFRCGAANRLVHFVGMLVGWIRGGLGMNAVVSTMLFSDISGSVNADAAAIGSVMIPPMEKAGYRREWAAAIVAAAAGGGVLVPPSITMIVLATVANLSVRALFLAAIIPAVLVSIAKMIVIFFRSRSFETRQEQIPFTLQGLATATWHALPTLGAPLIILGGILGGVFTATEAAAIAVLYSTILAVGYRTLTWRDIPGILLPVARLTGIVLSLLGIAMVVSYIFAYGRVSEQLQMIVGGYTDRYFVFTIFVIIIFWLLGALLDGTPALVILVPLFMPLAIKAGMNPIHFAVLTLSIIGISLVTPPLGTACIVVCGIADVPMGKLFRPIYPFILVLLVTMLLLVYVPSFSLWLPSLVLDR